jgi:hypothetical protein
MTLRRSIPGSCVDRPVSKSPRNLRRATFDLASHSEERNPCRAKVLGHMEKDNDQIVESAVEARGGRLGRPVLWVLIVSCALAVAFMIFTYVGTPKP